MAIMKIQDCCTNCAACEDECIPGAIHAGDDVYSIDAAACNGCEGEYASPRCAEVCPIDDCIVAAA
jgi:ferredoxin